MEEDKPEEKTLTKTDVGTQVLIEYKKHLDMLTTEHSKYEFIMAKLDEEHGGLVEYAEEHERERIEILSNTLRFLMFKLYFSFYGMRKYLQPPLNSPDLLKQIEQSLKNIHGRVIIKRAESEGFIKLMMPVLYDTAVAKVIEMNTDDMFMDTKQDMSDIIDNFE